LHASKHDQTRSIRIPFGTVEPHDGVAPVATRLPTKSRIYTCASSRYSESPKTSTASNRASCGCRLIVTITSLYSLRVATQSGKSRVIRHTANGPRHDTQDGARTVGLYSMLCVQSKSCFTLLNTVARLTRYMSRASRPLADTLAFTSCLQRCSRNLH
jgi:hypothetical protein